LSFVQVTAKWKVKCVSQIGDKEEAENIKSNDQSTKTEDDDDDSAERNNHFFSFLILCLSGWGFMVQERKWSNKTLLDNDRETVCEGSLSMRWEESEIQGEVCNKKKKRQTGTKQHEAEEKKN
jgi:hypothetical protein